MDGTQTPVDAIFTDRSKFVSKRQAEKSIITQVIAAKYESARLLPDIEPWMDLKQERLWYDHFGQVVLTTDIQGNSHTGRIVNVEFDTDNRKVRVRKVQLVDERTGANSSIDTADLQTVKTEQAASDWKQFFISRLTNPSFSRELEESLKNDGNVSGFIAGRNPETGELFAVSGRLTKKEISSSKSVYEIVDFSGKVNRFDPDWLDGETIIAYRGTSVVSDEPQFSLKEPIDLTDRKFSARAEAIKDLARNRLFFSDPVLYKYYEQNLDDAERFLRKEYGGEAERLITQAKDNIGNRFVALMVDPGITNRLSDLVTFLGSRPELLTKSLIEVRQAFSDHLGTRVLYRSMVLNDQEVEVVKRGGNSCLWFKRKRYRAKIERFI